MAIFNSFFYVYQAGYTKWMTCRTCPTTSPDPATTGRPDPARTARSKRRSSARTKAPAPASRQRAWGSWSRCLGRSWRDFPGKKQILEGKNMENRYFYQGRRWIKYGVEHGVPHSIHWFIFIFPIFWWPPLSLCQIHPYMEISIRWFSPKWIEIDHIYGRFTLWILRSSKVACWKIHHW